MSADPVTLAVISFGVQAAGTYQGIQAQKAANKQAIAFYEEEKKFNRLKALQDQNDVRDEADKKKKINRAIVAGSGYNDDSRSFLSVQKEIDRITTKDIGRIRINMLRGESKIQSQIYTTKVMGKAKEFGGYASIIAGGFKTASYAKSYKAGTTGQYGLDSDITETAKIRTMTEGSS
jgi:hypothetical protein